MPGQGLGKGLSALIPDKEKPKPKKTKPQSKKQVSKKSVPESNNFSLNDDKIEEIKDEVTKNPRISLWSLKASACLRYLKKTTPEFSISNEASLILEEAIAQKYPEIWELFEDM
ncbi:MAG: hypothetical protein E7Z84_05075 [Methanosphaera stadtmanae]|jgi:hypothetical protein|nr:hypothetical protein [Methanosphaera stadtmanae]